MTLDKNQISGLNPQTDSALSLFEEVLKSELNAIVGFQNRFKSSNVRDAIAGSLRLFYRSLENNGKIIVTGMGKSGKIAQKIAATLSSTGNLAVYLHPSEALHGDLGVISSKDVVFALSNSGKTPELVELLQIIKGRGLPIVSITGQANSPASQISDYWIDGGVEKEADPNNLAPTSSTTLSLVVGDAIALALVQMRNLTIDDFTDNHPGGTLGRRLRLRTSDLMHSGNDIGIVNLDSDMERILSVLAEKKQGAVIVSNSKNELLGIITDGDIRRSLKHREKFFQLSAQDIMTKDPISIGADTLASDALKLMEDRPQQISVLPVIGEDSRWKGLIRLHDIVHFF